VNGNFPRPLAKFVSANRTTADKESKARQLDLSFKTVNAASSGILNSLNKFPVAADALKLELPSVYQLGLDLMPVYCEVRH